MDLEKGPNRAINRINNNNRRVLLVYRLTILKFIEYYIKERTLVLGIVYYYTIY